MLTALLLLLPLWLTAVQVLALGADVKLPLAVGDKVVFQKYAMAEVEVPDGDILFVAEKSIMGKLE
jgi:chaperonin GroES